MSANPNEQSHDTKNTHKTRPTFVHVLVNIVT